MYKEKPDKEIFYSFSLIIKNNVTILTSAIEGGTEVYSIIAHSVIYDQLSNNSYIFKFNYFLVYELLEKIR